METITLGDKRIGIKTSVLEEKATACNMLCCYAEELKEGFYPWIDQVHFYVPQNFFIFSGILTVNALFRWHRFSSLSSNFIFTKKYEELLFLVCILLVLGLTPYSFLRWFFCN